MMTPEVNPSGTPGPKAYLQLQSELDKCWAMTRPTSGDPREQTSQCWGWKIGIDAEEALRLLRARRFADLCTKNEIDADRNRLDRQALAQALKPKGVVYLASADFHPR